MRYRTNNQLSEGLLFIYLIVLQLQLNEIDNCYRIYPYNKIKQLTQKKTKIVLWWAKVIKFEIQFFLDFCNKNFF